MSMGGFEVPAGVEFADDLDVQLDASTYQDAALPLPLAGNFGFRIKKSDLKTKYQTNELVMVDGKYPVLRLLQVEIVTPEALAGRVVYLPYQEFGTKPFFRQEGDPIPANNLADLLRSADQSVSFRGVEEGLKILEQFVAEGRVFHGKFDWLAEDKDWIKEQIKDVEAAKEAGNMSDEEARKAISEIRYKKGINRGFKNFVVDGKVDATWTGPSGNVIDARTVIRSSKFDSGFISQSQLDKFKLGLRKELQRG